MTLSISAIVTILIAICCIVLAYYFGILDKPGADIQPPRRPVPTLQGIGIIVSFFIIVGLVFPEYYALDAFQAIVIGGVIILLFTTIDEGCFLYPSLKQTRRAIFSYPRARLCMMILISTIAYARGGVMFDEISVGGYIVYFPSRLSLIVTLMWFVLSINAVNWIDGINGISTGISSIGFLTIYLLISRIVIPLYAVIEPEVIMAQQLSGILFIISLIYAYIERKPFALVRDVGVMFLGFMLAYLSLLGGGKIGIMIVALALVIFDAAWVIINRIVIMRKNPLKGDYTHLHHRLLRLGRSRSEVRVFVRGWSVFLMIIMLLQGSQTMNKFIIFVVMACMFFGVNIYLFWIRKLPYELLKKKS